MPGTVRALIQPGAARALIQIVPRRARSPEGVGDYARLLAEELAAAHGIETHFIACTPLPTAERAADRWPTATLEARTAAALGAALREVRARLPDAPVLLHQSGYGYQSRGVPLWLVHAIRRWRRDDTAARLVTLFHELSATGPVWTSSFWLQGAQRHVARRLLAASDAVATTTTPFHQRLSAWSRRAATLLPVFSNVGEDQTVTPASQRPATLVIFGREATANAVYGQDRASVEAFVAAAGITRILDIGARASPLPDDLAGARIDALGEAPVETVHQALRDARYGLLLYPTRYVEKSGIFAAYCAHGVIPVCLHAGFETGNGVKPGVNCLALPPVAPSGDGARLDRLQRGGIDWYAPHGVAGTASRLAALLEPSTRQAQH